MNVRQYSSDTRERTKAYGLVLDVQDTIVSKMTNTIENLRVKGRKALLPFQKGENYAYLFVAIFIGS